MHCGVEAERQVEAELPALPDQLAYVRAATLALHASHRRLPDAYFADPDVRVRAAAVDALAEVAPDEVERALLDASPAVFHWESAARALIEDDQGRVIARAAGAQKWADPEAVAYFKALSAKKS